jgi:hypothetical protein
MQLFDAWHSPKIWYLPTDFPRANNSRDYTKMSNERLSKVVEAIQAQTYAYDVSKISSRFGTYLSGHDELSTGEFIIISWRGKPQSTYFINILDLDAL